MSETKLRQSVMDDAYQELDLMFKEVIPYPVDAELENAVEDVFTESSEKIEAPKTPRFLKIREDAIAPGSHKRKQAEAASFEQDLDEEVEPTSRLGRIRKKLGHYSAMLTLKGMDVAENLVQRARKSPEQLDTEDTLTPSERRRKKIGIYAAGATLTTMALGSAFMMYKNGHTFSSGSTSAALSEPFLPDGSKNIAVGGNNDGSGKIITHMIDTWTGRPTEATVVDYPAGIAPKDPVTYDESARIGVDNLHNVIESTPGDKTVYSYSQGTVVAGEELSRIAEQNGGKLPDNIRAVFVSSPKTPGTGLHETAGEYFAGPMKMFGIDTSTGEIPLGENTTIVGARGDGISNMPDLAKNPLGAADSIVGYLNGRHWYGDVDPSQLQTRVAEDGTTYVTVLPKSGIDSPTLELAQQHGFYVSPQAEAFAEAIAPQVDTGGPQPTLNPSEILSTGAALIEDTAARNGMPIDLPDIPVMNMPSPNVIDTPSPAPMPTPAFSAPIGQWEAPQAPAPQWTAPVEQVAPMIQNAAPQINQAVEQVSTAVEQAVGGANTPAGQMVGDVTGQLQGALNQFLPR